MPLVPASIGSYFYCSIYRQLCGVALDFASEENLKYGFEAGMDWAKEDLNDSILFVTQDQQMYELLKDVL